MIVLRHYLHEKVCVTAAAVKGAWEMKYLNTNGVFFKILEMAISNNSSVIRTFDTGTRSEPCWVLDRCSQALPTSLRPADRGQASSSLQIANHLLLHL